MNQSDSTKRLGRWFDAHAAGLVLYARQWLDPAAAEDVVQEVFLKLLAQPIEPRNEKAWLFTAVRNAAIGAQRSMHRRVHRERTSGGDRAWFESRAEDLIDAAAAQVALSDLPADQREIVVLRIWGDLTLAEASEVLAEPVSTLFSRYKTGLAAIRRRMESSCKTNTI